MCVWRRACSSDRSTDPRRIMLSAQHTAGKPLSYLKVLNAPFHTLPFPPSSLFQVLGLVLSRAVQESLTSPVVPPRLLGYGKEAHRPELCHPLHVLGLCRILGGPCCHSSVYRLLTHLPSPPTLQLTCLASWNSLLPCIIHSGRFLGFIFYVVGHTACFTRNLKASFCKLRLSSGRTSFSTLLTWWVHQRQRFHCGTLEYFLQVLVFTVGGNKFHILNHNILNKDIVFAVNLWTIRGRDILKMSQI